MISDEKLAFLERFGDSDMQDMAATIRALREQKNTLIENVRVLSLQVEELEHSQMKRENNVLRKSITDIEKNYVEVVNENLELRRKIEELDNGWWKTRWA